MSRTDDTWPLLSYREWQDTYSSIHLWSQIIGKYRFVHTPWVNHSWHATLYVTRCGLTTGLVSESNRAITVDLDFCDHLFVARSDTGASETFPLGDMSVADFFQKFKEAITKLGGSPNIYRVPSEIPDGVPFDEDTLERPYIAKAAENLHEAHLKIDRVFKQFRTSFLGKVSPVHLFWGAFDLAVTRFSGRPAPLHPGGIPGLPDSVTREAYSHEVSSSGFWPGGSGVDEAMFYSYSYPEPEGFKSWKVRPSEAYYEPKLGEFLLPYDSVRSSDDPAGCLIEFLTSTYEAAAEAGAWDRARLECEPGRLRIPREVRKDIQHQPDKNSALVQGRPYQ